MTTSEQIKKFRQQKKLSQKELGKLIGVSQQMIGQWESANANLTLDTVQKIATALNISVNDLLESPLDDSPLYRAFKNNDVSDNPLEKHYVNSKLTEQIENWQQSDIELVKSFKKLNDSGKAVAIERVEELTEIPRYTQKETPDKEPHTEI